MYRKHHKEAQKGRSFRLQVNLRHTESKTPKAKLNPRVLSPKLLISKAPKDPHPRPSDGVGRDAPDGPVWPEQQP